MKKLGIAAAMLLAGTVGVSAITFSFAARGGFGAEVYGDTIDIFGFPSLTLMVGSSGDYSSYRNTWVNVGTGVRVIGGVDMELFKHVSLELMGGYFFTGVGLNFMDFAPSPSIGAVGRFATSFIPASLNIKLKAPMGKKSTLLAGFGPSFGFAPKTRFMIDIEDGADKDYIEAEMVYNIGFGYHGVLGMEFALGKHLFLLVEAYGEKLTFKPKKASITAYTVNGVDVLDTLDTADREIEYVKDLSNYANSPYNPDAPTQELAFNMPADSIQLFLGIAWKF